MKIVINIPEKYLNSNIIDVTLFTGANNTITDVNVENEYAEFQILPKGHGDLIDRDKFKPLMDEYFIDTSRLHYDDLTNAEHLNMGIESCLNELDEMEPVIKADK